MIVAFPGGLLLFIMHGKSLRLVIQSHFWSGVYIVRVLPSQVSTLLNSSLAEHDMPCLRKQCRSRSVWLLKKPTDLELHCLSLNMRISIKNLYQVI